MQNQEATEAPEFIYAKNGDHFKNEIGAKTAIGKQGLDRKVYRAFEHGDGWVIKRVSDPQPEYIETYHRVRFHAKSSPNDEDDVSLRVNGEVLIMQREQEVILCNLS